MAGSGSARSGELPRVSGARQTARRKPGTNERWTRLCLSSVSVSLVNSKFRIKIKHCTCRDIQGLVSNTTTETDHTSHGKLLRWSASLSLLFHAARLYRPPHRGRRQPRWKPFSQKSKKGTFSIAAVVPGGRRTVWRAITAERDSIHLFTQLAARFSRCKLLVQLRRGERKIC
jgi:hypothetical protein